MALSEEDFKATYPRKGCPMVPGNKLHKLRDYVNLDVSQIPMYNPAQLLDGFEEYCDWIARNPIKESFWDAKNSEQVEIDKMRAMTVKGFCLYLGISYSTFRKYSNDPKYQKIIEVIKDAIYVQKFEGAAAGVLNASVIIRDLNLIDQHKVDVDSPKKQIDQLFPEVEDIEAIDITDTKELPYGDISADRASSGQEED